MTAPVVVPREVAIERARRALIAAVRLRASRSPRDAAVAAWYPGHPLGSVEEIEAVIKARREAGRSAQAA